MSRISRDKSDTLPKHQGIYNDFKNNTLNINLSPEFQNYMNMLYPRNSLINPNERLVMKHKKNRKILYLKLINYEKIYEIINVTNENTNYGRILSGLLDIHTFYIKNSTTNICSYVNEWNVICKSIYFIKRCFVKCVVYIIFFIKSFHDFFPNKLYLRLSKLITQELLYAVLS